MRNLLLSLVIVFVTTGSEANELYPIYANLGATQKTTAFVDYPSVYAQASRMEEGTGRILADYYDGRRPARRVDVYSGLTRNISAYDSLDIRGLSDFRDIEAAAAIAEATVIPPLAFLEAAKVAYRTGWNPPTQDDECEECNGCQCPPLACNSGHCDHNYAAVFASKNCRFCPQMWSKVKKLRKDGYIVFYVDTDKYPGIFKDMKLRVWPTTLVFEDHKEKARFEGVTSAEKIAKPLKTRDEQGLLKKRVKQ
jgi:hypothetical protein